MDKPRDMLDYMALLVAFFATVFAGLIFYAVFLPVLSMVVNNPVEFSTLLVTAVIGVGTIITARAQIHVMRRQLKQDAVEHYYECFKKLNDAKLKLFSGYDEKSVHHALRAFQEADWYAGMFMPENIKKVCARFVVLAGDCYRATSSLEDEDLDSGDRNNYCAIRLRTREEIGDFDLVGLFREHTKVPS